MKNNVSSNTKEKRNGIISLKFIIALAAAAVLICSVPLMVSADVGNVYSMMYAISPEMAQTLKPVNASCEKEGVEMSVISADISGDTLSAYVAVSDKGAGVIDDKIDLYDSYSINTPFDAACGCKFDKYDSSSDTAYYYLTISDINGNNIEQYKNKKITFTLYTILADQEVYKSSIDGITLTDVQQDCQTEMIDNRRCFGGSSQTDDFSVIEELPCLIASDAPIASPTDFADITAIGFADDKLHVQVLYKDRMPNDTHGILWLEDEEGRVTDSVLSKLYSADKTEIDSYEENVFDVSYDDISDYTLHGEFSTYKTRIDGNWNVTFRID